MRIFCCLEQAARKTVLQCHAFSRSWWVILVQYKSTITQWIAVVDFKFCFSELPNDMKKLYFFAGELSNSPHTFQFLQILVMQQWISFTELLVQIGRKLGNLGNMKAGLLLSIRLTSLKRLWQSRKCQSPLEGLRLLISLHKDIANNNLNIQ